MGGKGKKKEEQAGPEEPVVSWHILSVDESVKELGIDPSVVSNGLTSSQAAERLAKYGPNKMTEKRKVTIWERIWHQVNNVLVLILTIVAIVSFVQAVIGFGGPENVISSWIQVGLIVGVISVNTFIGIYQEGSAEAAADALKSMLSSEAQVIRNGKQEMVDGTDIVPGDIVVLNLGDKIPADIRLTEVANLASGEAALTGESVPIDKEINPIATPASGVAEQVPLGDRKNMCFSATLIAQGSGRGLVVATGDNTQIGKINALVNTVEAKKTNVLEQIDNISKVLAICICIVGLATFLVALLMVKMHWLDALSTALICAVAMIPEGLEAIVTMTYSWAVANMAKNNAIIRALPAVETLGSVTVICSDKTGTLTKNEMSLTAFVSSDAKYKIDVDSKERVPTNFKRDDEYLAERADGEGGIKRRPSIENLIETGPNAKFIRPGTKEPENIFSVESHLNLTELEEEGKKKRERSGSIGSHEGSITSLTAVANGASPSLQQIKQGLACGILCSKCVLGAGGHREGEIGNPTEISILRAAYFAGLDIEEMKKTCPIVAEVPFSSDYKFMSTIHEPVESIHGNSIPDGKLVAYVKGAPDRMVRLCEWQATSSNEDVPIDTHFWLEQIGILSSHGLRVLALCTGTTTREEIGTDGDLGPEFVNGKGSWLTLVGLCAIMDPPRPECVDAIKVAHRASVRVAMITGDHKDTATAIGKILGIVDETYSEAITGPELDAMSDKELMEVVMTHNVFARASPENKIQIVKALQAKGQISSMTGDGVNDAPALKAANMGVAMGLEGTDVAREAAEMILADDNFATIVVAVREGRVVWDNLRKVLLVNTPVNNAQGLSVFFGLLCGLGQSPLTPIQVLYSNLICAVTLGFVGAVEPAEKGIMDLPPRRVGKRLIGRYLLLRILLATFTLTACVVGSAFWVKSMGLSEGQVHSQALSVLNFGAISVTLSGRFAYNPSLSKQLLFGNKLCWYSVAIVVALQVAIIYIPGLNYTVFRMEGMIGFQWVITVIMMVIVFVIMELEKWGRRILSAQGKDTDDRDEWVGVDEHIETDKVPEGGLVPKDAHAATMEKTLLHK